MSWPPSTERHIAAHEMKTLPFSLAGRERKLRVLGGIFYILFIIIMTGSVRLKR